MIFNFFYLIVLIYYIIGLLMYAWITKTKYVISNKQIPPINLFNEEFEQLLLEE